MPDPVESSSFHQPILWIHISSNRAWTIQITSYKTRSLLKVVGKVNITKMLLYGE
jgi:hypothetical protein